MKKLTQWTPPTQTIPVAHVLLFLGFSIFVSASAFAQRTFTVNDTLDAVDVAPGDNLCASERGTCTLRAAVMEANATNYTTLDTIRLPAGVYQLTVPPEEGPFSPSADGGDLYFGHSQPLDLFGAGRDDTLIEQTVVDRVLRIGGGANVNMSGVTLRGGNSVVRDSPDYSVGYGGGLSTSGNVIFSNARVTGNTAERSGGGIANANYGRLTLFNVEILSNQSTSGNGGGMSVAGPLVMIRTQVSGNRAVKGGGVYVGGPVRAENIKIALSHITDNQAVGRVRSDGFVEERGLGGGLYMFFLHWPWVDSRPGVVEYTTISGNSALFGGGVYQYGFDPMEFRGSLIANNTAYGGGGVMHRAQATYLNTTISGNIAHEGGAIEFRNAGVAYAGTPARNELTLRHVTLANNEGRSGVMNNAPHRNIIRAGGTIFANLSAEKNFGSAVPIISMNNNLDTGISTGAMQPNDLLATGPLLLPLADNGGPTWTHELSPASPALDAHYGSCADADQRNAPRPAGARCDIGAFESGATPARVVILPVDWLTRMTGVLRWYVDLSVRSRLSLQGIFLHPLSTSSKQSQKKTSKAAPKNLSFDVLGGSRTDEWLQLTLRGGVRFTRKSENVTLRVLSLSTDLKGGFVRAALSHEWEQGHDESGELILLVRKPRWNQKRFKARLVLTKEAAQRLNESLDTKLFKAGMDLGRVTAQLKSTETSSKKRSFAKSPRD